MSRRTIAAVLVAAAAAGTALAGPSSVALAAGPASHGPVAVAAPVVSDPAEPILTHLKLDTIMADDWDSIDVWELDADPQVPDGGVFFLYDPDQQQVLDGFDIPGDRSHALRTTTDWQQVIFYAEIRPGRSRVEVRYGSVDDPTNAQVVASAQKPS